MTGNCHVRCGAGEKPEVLEPEAYLSLLTLPEDFLTILTTARKHDISFSIIIQAISQLKPLFDKEQFKTLIGSCDEFLYLGSGEFDTHKEISERIGKETIVAKGYSQSKGRNGSYSSTEQLVGRYLLDPSEVDTRLGEQDAMVKIRGSRWIIDRKIDPARHPNFKHSADGGGEIFNYAEQCHITGKVEEQRGYNGEEREKAIYVDMNALSAKVLSRIEIYTDDDFV